jgi:hypothetical protein
LVEEITSNPDNWELIGIDYLKEKEGNRQHSYWGLDFTSQEKEGFPKELFSIELEYRGSGSLEYLGIDCYLFS